MQRAVGLHDDARLFRTLLESAPDAIVLVDAEGRVVLVNDRVEELFGYPPEELLGKPVELLVPAPLREAHAAHRGDFAADPHRRPMGMGLELSACRRDGSAVPVDITLSPVETSQGPLVMAVVRDMTEQRIVHDRLRWLADHDVMTGLLNRTAFEAELARLVAESQRYGGGALLLVDLDGFKARNDMHGHAAGDDLLRRVAGALRGRLRATDVLGRLGGDEFVAVLPRAGRADAVRAAEGLVDAVRRAGAEPPPPVTASVGVTLMAPSLDAAHLLARADAAMYEAKGAGGDGVTLAE